MLHVLCFKGNSSHFSALNTLSQHAGRTLFNAIDGPRGIKMESKESKISVCLRDSCEINRY